MTRAAECGKALRGGSRCSLGEGHRGRHTSVTFVCDSCGKSRPGVPYARGPEGLGFCFLCSGPPAQRGYYTAGRPE